MAGEPYTPLARAISPALERITKCIVSGASWPSARLPGEESPYPMTSAMSGMYQRTRSTAWLSPPNSHFRPPRAAHGLPLRNQR